VTEAALTITLERPSILRRQSPTRPAPAGAFGGRAATWQRAADAWLQSKPSPNTRRAYRAAFRRFLEFAGRPPWLLSGADAIAWQAHLRRQGLADSTINLYLAAVSSYFRFCNQHYTLTDPATGRERPLAHTNPALRPTRAKVKPYGKAAHLDLHQVRALLRAPDRTTIQGLRDYALLKSYLLTGFRNSELRTLRWGDLQRDGDRIFCRWRGKGSKTDQIEFPWPAYHAIIDFLQAAGRWEPSSTAYIFTALSDAAAYLPNVNGTRRGTQPLTSAMVNRLVKKYARWAGLDHTRITTHTLRHTAAMLRAGLTDDLREIQRFLNHTHLNTTQIYLQHAGRRRDNLWMQVEALIGVD
jgi:integrase/recombinase XerD